MSQIIFLGKIPLNCIILAWIRWLIISLKKPSVVEQLNFFKDGRNLWCVQSQWVWLQLIQLQRETVSMFRFQAYIIWFKNYKTDGHLILRIAPHCGVSPNIVARVFLCLGIWHGTYQIFRIAWLMMTESIPDRLSITKDETQVPIHSLQHEEVGQHWIRYIMQG